MGNFEFKNKKEYQPEIDFNGAQLEQTINDINKNNIFFKLDKNNVSFDGEKFLIDGLSMSASELKLYASQKEGSEVESLYIKEPDDYRKGQN